MKCLKRPPIWTGPSELNDYIKARGWEGVDWAYLAQDEYKWRAVINTVMDIRVPIMQIIS